MSGWDNVVGEGRGGGGGGSGEGVEGVESRIYPLVVCFWYSRRGRSQGDHLLCSAGHSFVFLLHHAPPQIEKRPPHTAGVRKVTSRTVAALSNHSQASCVRLYVCDCDWLANVCWFKSWMWRVYLLLRLPSRGAAESLVPQHTWKRLIKPLSA